jgi:hypothetical protein
MAACDYRSCDVCGGKAFYDANLSYEDGADGDSIPYRIAGEPHYDKPEILSKYGQRLGYVGDWAVICDDCAKTHKTQIVPIANAT